MKLYHIIAATAALVGSIAANAQKAPECKIPTRWASEVSTEAPHCEYPRPQMIRQQWQSLNGLWDYSITCNNAPEMGEAQGSILVPFAPESMLSGVGRLVGENDALWYRKYVNVPKEWAGKNIMLNFDAVDWAAEVFVNDILVGTHTGGYTAFSLDITPYLQPKGLQKIELRVTDSTDSEYQPRGKQVSKPEGIWYTRVSGIWQSVWMEPVADTRIASYYVTSDIRNSSFKVSADLVGAKPGDVVLAELIEGCEGYSSEEPGSNVIASAKSAAGQDLTLRIGEIKTWAPGSPYIYGLRLSVISGGKVCDKVDGYAIAREIGTMRDGLNHRRITLNGEPMFQFGPLDQGWWPDGLYTAPSDEALAYDIRKTIDFGFNMIRKHIKIEPARWYWHCDRMGIVVWQDMPSVAAHKDQVWDDKSMGGGNDHNVPEQWKQNYYKEWAEIIEQRKFFQSIVVWVPFNEAWGQFDTEKVVEFTHNLDPTRLINSASGGNHRECGDICDLHHYPQPKMRMHDGRYVMALGEYGGIGLPLEGHLWNPDMRNWGYIQYKNAKDVTDRYEEYAKMLKALIPTGCSAGVYTQTTDVEGEVNGLMTYDREIIKMEESRLRSINQSVINALK